MRTRTWMVAAVLCLMASVSWGAEFSTSAMSVAGQVGGGVVEGGCGATLLTQSTSQSVIAGSVACNAAGFHTDNSYFRAYDMSGFPDGFDVCEVQLGVELAAGAGGTQPITVNVYANSGGAFPAGTLTLLGTAPVSVADQALTVLTVPLAASVPAATTEMVLEVFAPDGRPPVGNRFFIGSNNLGQSGLSYLQAADCLITAPTPTGDVGFPNMHIVLNAAGDAVVPVVVVEVPALGGWGLALLGVVLAGVGFVVLRKRAVA